jgi:hypothetical protein
MLLLEVVFGDLDLGEGGGNPNLDNTDEEEGGSPRLCDADGVIFLAAV